MGKCQRMLNFHPIRKAIRFLKSFFKNPTFRLRRAVACRNAKKVEKRFEKTCVASIGDIEASKTPNTSSFSLTMDALYRTAYATTTESPKPIPKKESPTDGDSFGLIAVLALVAFFAFWHTPSSSKTSERSE